MNNIEIGKVYVSNDGGFYKTPIAVKGEVVVYWWTSIVDCIGEETNASHKSVQAFLENNKLYKKPMTFQRIKDEGIKTLVDNIGQVREVIGFASDGSLVTYMANWGAAHWYGSEVKDWEAV